MGDDADRQRPKRRCVKRKAVLPSAVHYVGYVEDEETPEMIMKKFEELDRLVSSAAGNSNPGAAAAASSRSSGPSCPAPSHEPLPPPPPPATSLPGQLPGSCSLALQPHHLPAAGVDMTLGPEALGPSELDPGPCPQPSAPQQQGPDEQLLLELFKRTSYFNVRSVVQDTQGQGAARGGGTTDPPPGGCDAWDVYSSGTDADVPLGLWSEDDDGCESSDGEGKAAGGGGVRRGGGLGGGAPKGRAERGTKAGGSARERHTRHQVLIQYNRDTNALIRRKVRPAQRDGISELRVPPAPLPPSWGRTVQPFDPTALLPHMQALSIAGPGTETESETGAPSSRSGAAVPEHGGSGTGGIAVVSEPGTAYYETADVVQLLSSCRGLLGSSPWLFQAVMVDCGWELGPQDGALMERFRCIPLQRLCPTGFVLVWAKKQHIAAIMKQLHAWSYQYVENLTCVWLHPNHSIMKEASPYALSSHLTLLIFRKEGEGKDIELKHQRSPDVVFDCQRATNPGSACKWEVPSEVYDIIETMLPTGKGLFLELWASRGTLRKGWTRVAEVKGS